MCEQSLVNYLATDLDGKVSKEDLDKLIKSGESVAEYEATYVAKKENNPNYDGRYGQAILPKSIEKFAEDIDESLADIKICDPAIGSGAFPVGMMNEIVKSRAVLSIYIKNPRRTIYGFKRDCIQNSLYGVDIDSGAVEIAKLRLWLSLVVDEDDINQIKPLPNLDYKIMQGNSLLEEFENVKLFDEKLITTVDVGKEKQIELLKQKQTVLQKQYFELHSENKLTPAKQAELNSGLKKLQTQINKLSQTETVETEKSGLFDVYSEAKKKAEELKRLHKEFFDATQKSKKDDIKKHIERLGWDLIEATLKEQNKISQLKKIEEFKKSNTKPFFLWRLNFADVFEDKGGFDVVIANPPYVSYYSRESAKTANTTKELSILREKFDFTKYERKTGRLNLWMFFAEKFVKLLRINGVSSFIVDVNFTKDLAKNIRKYLLENMSIKQFIHDLSEFEYVASGQVILIAQKDNDVSCNKILIKSSLLGPGMQIQQSGISEPDYSFFVLTTDTIISKLSKETKLGELKQLQLTTGVQIGGIEIYKGKPIKDYFYKTDWDYKNVFPAVDPTSVRRYSKSKFERGIVFDYELASKITEATEKSAVVLRKYKDFLDNEKILIRQSASEILATIAAPKTCGEYSLFSLISNDKNFSIKYLLALFNSKIYTYFAVKSGIVLMKKGTQPQIRKSGLEKLPIKRISLSSQQPFIDLVDKILTITKDDDYLNNSTKQAKVRDIEHQVDELVYKLYGLTEEEIRIVESTK
ncbi:MAG: TaqI-like C-terminal specificity domain-containing protein [Patescibacteria group bacterium]